MILTAAQPLTIHKAFLKSVQIPRQCSHEGPASQHDIWLAELRWLSGYHLAQTLTVRCCSGKPDIVQHRADLAAAPVKESVAIDREVVASAVVLRDVHCALLRVIEGQPLSAEATPPLTSQLILPAEARASQAQWCDRAANAVFRAQEPIDQDAWVHSSMLSIATVGRLNRSCHLVILLLWWCLSALVPCKRISILGRHGWRGLHATLPAHLAFCSPCLMATMHYAA